MKTYKNNGGTHVALDGTVTKPGETITTDEDLVAAFGKKFSIVVPEVVEAPAAPEAPATPKKPKAPKADGMKDVTADFQSAVDAGLIVKKNKSGWHVYDGDAEPANEDALYKKNVAAFIEDLLAE